MPENRAIRAYDGGRIAGGCPALTETEGTTLTRTEEDLLGTREVPDDAYWGIHTLRAIENYQISGRTINEAPELIRAFAQVKKACAMANMQLKAMKPVKAEAIISACDEIIETGAAWTSSPSISSREAPEPPST